MNTNAIAIHGNFTEDGLPYLACDPHMGLSFPPMFNLVEMSFGSDFLIGSTVAGAPGILMGRTKHFAMAGTSSYADNLDLWQEEVNEEYTNYLVDG
jgi:penicillin amidase